MWEYDASSRGSKCVPTYQGLLSVIQKPPPYGRVRSPTLHRGYYYYGIDLLHTSNSRYEFVSLSECELKTVKAEATRLHILIPTGVDHVYTYLERIPCSFVQSR